MPFERCDGIQGELAIGLNLLGGARHDHGGDGLITFEEFFNDLVGDRDEVSFEVF